MVSGATCDLSYVETTGHKVGNSFDQHEEDLKTYNQTNDLENATALVHLTHPNAINFRRDTDYISVVYKSLLKQALSSVMSIIHE